jgi:hypothetical protein
MAIFMDTLLGLSDAGDNIYGKGAGCKVQGWGLIIF